jgi:uncharacterized protein
LAYYYLQGYGVEADPQKAAYWYQAAALSGQPEAQAEIGQLMLTGTGVDKDYEQAVYWFTKSAEQGNPMAQAKLGYMYLAGLGVAKNWVKAYVFYKAAAENKNPEAEKQLKILDQKLSSEDIKAANEMIKEMKEGKHIDSSSDN